MLFIDNGKVDVEKFKVRYRSCIVPPDWFDLIDGSMYASGYTCWKHSRTRREADDAAAAFARLSSRRRAALLNPGG